MNYQELQHHLLVKLLLVSFSFILYNFIITTKGFAFTFTTVSASTSTLTSTSALDKRILDVEDILIKVSNNQDIFFHSDSSSSTSSSSFFPQNVDDLLLSCDISGINKHMISTDYSRILSEQILKSFYLKAIDEFWQGNYKESLLCSLRVISSSSSSLIMTTAIKNKNKKNNSNNNNRKIILLHKNTWIIVGSIFDKYNEFKDDVDMIFEYVRTFSSVSSSSSSSSSPGFLKEFAFLGPFITGKTELDGDPVYAQYYYNNNNDNNNDNNNNNFNLSQLRRYHNTSHFPSEMVEFGYTTWSLIQQNNKNNNNDNNYYLEIQPTNVNWQSLVNTFSQESLEFQGHIVADVFIDVSGKYEIMCSRLHSFYLDWGNQLLPGDIYGNGELNSYVYLERGLHVINARLRAKIKGHFQCKIEYVSSSIASSLEKNIMTKPTIMKDMVKVFNPHFMPDLVDGYLFSNFFSIPVANMMDDWIRFEVINEKNDPSGLNVYNLQNENINSIISSQIAPGQTTPIPFEIKYTNDQKKKCKGGDINWNQEFQIIKNIDDTVLGRFNVKLKLRCRKKRQSFLFTFIDHDFTISQAASIVPFGKRVNNENENGNEKGKKQCLPVFLTLHGTSISPQDQADSYKYMPKNAKDYRFGVADTWLVAPTRHGAHNWETMGYMTAQSATRAIKVLADQSPFSCADISRILYAGHSMGGHGAWVQSVNQPDKALAVVSSAGWLTKESYGDANTFFKLDISTSSIDPALKYILESSVIENNVEHLVSNLKGIDVLARVGQNDNTVHPWFVRRINRLLTQVGVNVKLSELVSKEHWWWDTKKANDGGVNNDLEMRNFFSTHIDNLPQLPLTFSLTLYNPATFEGKGGIKVLQLIIPFQKATIEVSRNITNKEQDTEEWNLITKNILSFKLSSSLNQDQLQQQHAKIIKLIIDGSVIENTNINEKLCRLKNGDWIACSKDVDGKKYRQAEQYGPIRQVHSKPVYIIVGSVNMSKEEVDEYINIAIYLANLYYITADTFVKIFLDRDVDYDKILLNKDINLIVIGDPIENSIYKQIIMNQNFSFEKETEERYCSATKLKTQQTFQTLPSVSFSRTVNNQKFFSFGPCEFSDNDDGAIFLTPSGLENLVLVIAGNSPSALRNILHLALPTIPPMARSPFTNLLPDFIVANNRLHAEGIGGVSLAGYWGNYWDWDRHLAYNRGCPFKAAK